MQRTKLRCRLHILVPGLFYAFVFTQACTLFSSEPLLLPTELVDEVNQRNWYQGDVIPLNVETNAATNLLVAHNESAAAKTLAPYEERPIKSLGIDISRTEGQLPTDRAIEDQVFEKVSTEISHRHWPISTRTWVASKTRHRPLYFEEVNAERYGYTCSRTLQPAISTAHFFGTIPMLPYLMAADGPCECNYTLGHYRPGSCNPYRHHRWPRSLKGVGVEAVVAVGMIALIP